MASERQRAKAAITSRSSDEPKFDVLMSDAEQYQLELARETNRHKESMRAADIGVVGRFLGADGNAAQAIAFLIVILGFTAAFGCLFAAFFTRDQEFWGHFAERALAVALAAGSYIFGRGDRRNR